MQKNDVESALRLGNARQQLLEIGVPPEEKQIKCRAARINADRTAAVILGFEVFAKFRESGRALVRVREWIGIPVEIWIDCFAELLEVKTRKVPNHSMRWKNR